MSLITPLTAAEEIHRERSHTALEQLVPWALDNGLVCGSAHCHLPEPSLECMNWDVTRDSLQGAKLLSAELAGMNPSSPGRGRRAEPAFGDRTGVIIICSVSSLIRCASREAELSLGWAGSAQGCHSAWVTMRMNNCSGTGGKSFNNCGKTMSCQMGP